MATRSVSPGAALLRTSRMFSLPPALPQPYRDDGWTQSDTATEPYPTRQIITTTSLSRTQGDWGLKRPLPLKTTTKGTYPMIKVMQVDSIEAITDFGPAADHGITLKKFQEMNIPITLPNRKGGMHLPRKSVFEDSFDFTALPEGEAKDDMDMRWKFKGPWLAGLSDGQLEAYMQKRVRHRRNEFRDFLSGKLAKELNETAAQKAKDSGDGEASPAEIQASSITQDQLTHFIRRLRDDRPRLYKLVSQFLDLAPIGPPVHSSMWNPEHSTTPITITVGNPYAMEGPPVTHPSAGLSYLRTASYLENHPFYGPQAKHTPVEARVVAPRHSGGARGAKLGVGGFVTQVPGGESTFNMNRPSPVIRKEQPGLERLDPSIKGGAKFWVEPLNAMVNSKGRTIVTVDATERRESEIAKELAGRDAVVDEPAAPSQAQSRAALLGRQRYVLGTRMLGSSKTYGLTGDLAFDK